MHKAHKCATVGTLAFLICSFALACPQADLATYQLARRKNTVLHWGGSAFCGLVGPGYLHARSLNATTMVRPARHCGHDGRHCVHRGHRLGCDGPCRARGWWLAMAPARDAELGSWGAR